MSVNIIEVKQEQCLYPAERSHLFSHCWQDKWESYASTNEPFELFKHVSLMTLDSIMKCAFSCYSNCQTEGWAQMNLVKESFTVSVLCWVFCCCKSAFNVCLLCHFSGTNAYIKAVYDLSFLIDLRLRMFPYHSDLIFHLSPHGFRYRKARQVALSHTGKLCFDSSEPLPNVSEPHIIVSDQNSYILYSFLKRKL